jgi:hypothetical protein
MPDLLEFLVGMSLPPAPSAKAHQNVSSSHFCLSVEFSSTAALPSNHRRHMNISNNRAKAIRNDSFFRNIPLNLSFYPSSQATRLELQQAPYSNISIFIGVYQDITAVVLGLTGVKSFVDPSARLYFRRFIKH